MTDDERRGLEDRERISATSLIIILLILVLILAAFHRPSPPMLIDGVTQAKVDADWRQCVTVAPPPLLRTPRDRADYRLGRPFNDKGVS